MFEECFKYGVWIELEMGVFVLKDVLVNFDCEIDDI